MRTITLIDGRTVQRDSIRFEAGNMRFYLGAEDITNNIFRSDKLTFRGFDVNADNRRISYERNNGVRVTEIPGPLTTSTAAIFAEQIVTEPLAAPLESLENQTKKIFSNLGVQMGIALVVIGVFVWMGGLTLIKGMFSKP